ncbi:response regulator receiver sensor signal transduction histidine kinase [Candidatus Vecturithrix granuli]|uniref:histidine kinase n=1 Tax=Vecturithrix granuli TaxID=1499967 RepID=A0A081C7R2_VECG1|nr:response regulator receiver sensor signal transduction histidine kinase [Candidatus Vecturithrix granuli]
MNTLQNTESPATILIVDDLSDNLRLLSGILQNQGYLVRLLREGQMVLPSVLGFPPDIILLDIMMPDLSGHEVCHQLKADERTRDIPVIFLSALHGVADKVKAFAASGVDYITKPFQNEEVLARVKAHLTIRRQQQLIQEQYAALQTLNASKDTFFSIIAHDLRNPFGGFVSMTELLEQQLESWKPEQVKQVVSELRRSAERLFALLENLLTWSRLQRGVMEYRPEPVILYHLVERSVALLNQLATQKDIHLRNLIDPSILVFVDVAMIDTVMRNLISNALKFTPSGGSVTLSASQDDQVVEVAISDTGIGIPAEKIPLLFRIDAKYQRRGTAGEPGTGLGLVLCQELLERHGGQLRVESEIGKGTCFTCTLPKVSR